MAQDPQFSQFYAASNYLNPAFAGAAYENRVTLNYRHQWPSIPQAFVSYNAAYDKNIREINSGVGFLMTHDKAGTGGLQFTNLALQFSHQFRLKRDLYLRPAIQYAFTLRSLDYTKLTFGDQLIRNNAPTTIEPINTDVIKYFDFSSGALLYSSTRWVGFSAHHINRPNESLTGNEAGIPVKFSVHGGAKIPIQMGMHKVEDAITAAFNYKAQSKFDQFDVGFYFGRDAVILGLWYRGIPGFKAYEPGYQNNDAVIILVGTEVDNLKIGYSYDITISRLMSNTAGSHEISLTYQWAKNNEEIPLSKQKREVPCPKF